MSVLLKVVLLWLFAGLVYGLSAKKPSTTSTEGKTELQTIEPQPGLNQENIQENAEDAFNNLYMSGEFDINDLVEASRRDKK